MSSSIAIPKRRRPRQSSYGGSCIASSSSSAATPISDSAASSFSSYQAASSTRTPSSASPSMGSTTMPADSSTQSKRRKESDRRPSLLGTSLSHSEYTVINVAGPDGPPRLVTCVKSSQGFDWNQDIFLPSYIDYDSSDLERKPDPVEDIILTDEEAAAMLPQ
ncbi:inosine-5'-monophosphate dehydrogenase [Elsinoe australis]|uniref:Inosine-5'-monophosphate dehydrogenase n=1 Tax=Elsinoe australis TaxID=40998 RepID=A0A2P8A8J0_9PEZI|nr:inosine-5'-monophosphate dehydrogenase [Elsinoe australis]